MKTKLQQKESIVQLRKYYHTLPDNLTVGGNLDLRSTSITTLPDNLTVVGYLYLRSTSITTLPDNLTVGGYLDLSGTPITTLPDNLTVGGNLYLRGTSITTLPDNLTVGGNLDLRSTPITTLPDNLTVGGNLYLRGTSITTLPDNLTVGGSLDLEGTPITTLPDNIKDIPSKLKWQNGKYIKVDGIFSEVVKKKGNTYTLRNIGNPDHTYLVTNGKFHAHGATVIEAKEDLRFKLMSYKIKQDGITLDTEITIPYYRALTGACREGCKMFVESNGLKDKYKVSELLPILRANNAYGLQKFESYLK